MNNAKIPRRASELVEKLIFMKPYAGAGESLASVSLPSFVKIAANNRKTRRELLPLLINGRVIPFVGSNPITTDILKSAWAVMVMVRP